MKSKVTLLFLFIMISSQLKGQWTELNSGTNESIRGIWFMDSNEGVAVGENSTIIKTFDAGETWSNIENNANNHLFSIFFPDNQTGYITGGNGVVLKSIDKGNTWTKIKEGGVWLFASYFLTPDLGYIGGTEGGIFKTIDGGQNWTSLSLGNLISISSIFFSSENIGYFAGSVDNNSNNSGIIKTLDGGDSFEELSTGSTSPFEMLHAVFFTDIDNGFVTSIGEPVTILRTNDGGQNWEEEIFNLPQDDNTQGLYDIHFFDSNNGIAVGGAFIGSNVILRTNDGGDSWNEEISQSEDDRLHDVFMISENQAFIVGDNGKILKLEESVSVDNLEFQSVEIFPNPVQNGIIIKGENTGKKIKYSISDSNGIVVKRGNIYQNEYINLQDINSGIYFLTLSKGTEMKTFEVLKK